MIILGIDPGLQKTGWGVIKSESNNLRYIDCGQIKTIAKQPLPERINYLFEEVGKIVKQYKPGRAAIEETFVNKNAMSSLKLGHARAAAMLAITRHNIPVSEYASKLIKKSVVGVGAADKNQVIMMVKQILPSAIVESEDAADALAVAVCDVLNTRTLEGMKA